MPGVWGVQGVWGPSPPSPILFTASDIWDKGPSSRGYCPDTIPTKIYYLILFTFSGTERETGFEMFVQRLNFIHLMSLIEGGIF